MTDIRLGAIRWNQYTTWPELLAGGRRADRLGFDPLWMWVLGEPARYRSA